jgi:hypothetical protein
MNPDLKLHDIVEVEAVGWWPPAWGWWLLGSLLIVAMIALVVFTTRFQRQRRARRAALYQLQDHTLSMAQVTLLTKQAALAYFPRQQIAALSGERWFGFLISTMPARQQDSFATSLHPWVEQLYMPQEESAEEYRQLMLHWIKCALPPTSREAAHV